MTHISSHSWASLPGSHPTPLGHHRAPDWTPWVTEQLSPAIYFMPGWKPTQHYKAIFLQWKKIIIIKNKLKKKSKADGFQFSFKFPLPKKVASKVECRQRGIYRVGRRLSEDPYLILFFTQYFWDLHFMCVLECT